MFGAVHGAHRPGCFGGILGDDTGLGKTIQTVALVGTLVKHQLAARILIIVPVTLVPVWAEQFSTHMAEGARPAGRRRRRRRCAQHGRARAARAISTHGRSGPPGRADRVRAAATLRRCDHGRGGRGPGRLRRDASAEGPALGPLAQRSRTVFVVCVRAYVRVLVCWRVLERAVAVGECVRGARCSVRCYGR